MAILGLLLLSLLGFLKGTTFTHWKNQMEQSSPDEKLTESNPEPEQEQQSKSDISENQDDEI